MGKIFASIFLKYEIYPLVQVESLSKTLEIYSLADGRILDGLFGMYVSTQSS